LNQDRIEEIRPSNSKFPTLVSRNGSIFKKGIEYKDVDDGEALFYQNISTSSGHSGSPILVKIKGKWKIVGIHLGDSKLKKGEEY
jgi:hypothetical protein